MMGLTIQRTVGEKVILTCSNGEEIIIEVKKAKNHEALRLSFDAPKSVKIYREELVNNNKLI
ncbi:MULTISPECIES: carbon storage regulator [Bacillaceae]|uniref:carbon storage regulator n=1 Tax=Bacillaceae TaxID=186817 RepID=UPI001ABF8EC7|nr:MULTISPECIES: carbon storage regulator [Bacillaceae]